MIKHPEVSPELDENAQRYIVSEDLRFIPLQKEGHQSDPVFELFFPPTSSRRGVSQNNYCGACTTIIMCNHDNFFLAKLDPLDVSNCHGVANVVAAVLACPPRSNHLWYLMFAADELEQTYMTGFMVSGMKMIVVYNDYSVLQTQ